MGRKMARAMIVPGRRALHNSSREQRWDRRAQGPGMLVGDSPTGTSRTIAIDLHRPVVWPFRRSGVHRV